MAIIAKDSGDSVAFEPCPQGNHIARCIGVVDMGNQENEYLGEVSYPHKVVITWEIPAEIKTYIDKEGAEISGPFTVGEWFTLSLNEKANLTAILEGWRGKAFTEQEKDGFDITNILGKPCMLNVTHKTKQNGGIKTRIQSASALPKGITCPPQVNDSMLFAFDDYSEESFNRVSNGLQKKIMTSPQYKVASGQIKRPEGAIQPEEPSVQDEFDDIPF